MTDPRAVGPVRLTTEQRSFLSSLRADGSWTWFGIKRDGTRRYLAGARQQCRLRGLAERHPDHRRDWRITLEGRAALAGAEPVEAGKEGDGTDG